MILSWLQNDGIRDFSVDHLSKPLLRCFNQMVLLSSVLGLAGAGCWLGMIRGGAGYLLWWIRWGAGHCSGGGRGHGGECSWEKEAEQEAESSSFHMKEEDLSLSNAEMAWNGDEKSVWGRCRLAVAGAGIGWAGEGVGTLELEEVETATNRVGDGHHILLNSFLRLLHCYQHGSKIRFFCRNKIVASSEGRDLHVNVTHTQCDNSTLCTCWHKQHNFRTSWLTFSLSFHSWKSFSCPHSCRRLCACVYVHVHDK